MLLELVLLPADRVYGIYGANEVKYKKPNGEIGTKLKPHDQLVTGTMPQRMRKLHPAAAKSYLDNLADLVVVSDMLRSGESSLQAVREGRGAQPPSFSGHNYGFSIDIAIEESMRRAGLATKADLDEWMNSFGWYCHRMDHKMDHEAWHYNFLGDGYTDRDGGVSRKAGSTNGYLQAKIKKIYGAQMVLTAKEAQAALQELKLYKGEIDGVFGPRSQEATRMFQRMMDLKPTGKLDDTTMRTLAFLTADVKEVTL